MDRFETRVSTSSAAASVPARSVEKAVFLEVFGNTSEVMDAEYVPYDPTSVFVSVYDRVEGLTAGVARGILPGGPAGLKSLSDLAGEPWGQDPQDVLGRLNGALVESRTVDVATLAVLPEYRGRAMGGVVSQALYQGVFQMSLALGYESMVAIMDEPVYNLLQRTLRGWKTFPGVEPGPYLDSLVSVPAWESIPEWSRALEAFNPRLHAHHFGGVPFPGVTVPDSWVPVP